MYTAAGHVLTINGANKTASVRMDGLDLAVLTEEDGRRRLYRHRDDFVKGTLEPLERQSARIGEKKEKEKEEEKEEEEWEEEQGLSVVGREVSCCGAG